MSRAPLAPGASIGILGGGQLGRMLAQAAISLDLRVHIYCPENDAPASHIADRVTTAPYEDEEALGAFADSVERVTYEFENIPENTAHFLATRTTVYPPPRALAVAQDRWLEKSFIQDLGVAVAPFFQIDQVEDIADALTQLGGSGIIKTRRFGYDGKGQWRVNAEDDLAPIADALSGRPAIIEGLIPFTQEISILVARAEDGAVMCFDPAENIHENHILRTSLVPGSIAPNIAKEAQSIAHKIAAALDYVGVLAIELFVTPDNILVNEIAPRVHNSGHWTMDACETSQFTQHLRAIAGWPLGSAYRHSDVEMTNILGDEIDTWRTYAADPHCHLHLYGKGQARPGRKMGHVNRLSPRASRSANATSV